MKRATFTKALKAYGDAKQDQAHASHVAGHTDWVRCEKVAGGAKSEALSLYRAVVAERDALRKAKLAAAAQLAAATKRLAEAEKVIAPFARLSVQKKTEGNAGFYSLRFADIEAARAWQKETSDAG